MSVSACCARAGVVQQPRSTIQVGGVPGFTSLITPPTCCDDDSGEIDIPLATLFDFVVPIFPNLTPLTPPVTVLSGEGSLLFTNPSPGVLRYVGSVPRRVTVHATVSMQWTDSSAPPAPGTEAGFGIGIIVTRAAPPATEQFLSGGSIAELVFQENFGVFVAQAVVLLQPGDELQIGITANLTPGEVETMTLAAYSLMAA